MEKLDNRKLFNFIKDSINKEIERINAKIDENRSKLIDPTKKLGLVDKYKLKSLIKSYEEKISNLERINNAFDDLRFCETALPSISAELKSNFKEFGSLLSEQEVNQLNDFINDIIRNSNKEAKEKIEQEALNVEKLLEQFKMTNREIAFDVTYQKVLWDAKKVKLNELNNLESFYIINREIKDNPLAIIVEMNAYNEFEKTESVQKILENLTSIKEAVILKKKANDLLSLIPKIISKLEKVSNIDFSKLINYLKEIEKKYSLELDKANMLLNQFDFSDIRKQVNDYKLKNRLDNIKNNHIEECKRLAYELRRAESEEPYNHDKINTIKKEIEQFEATSTLSREELESAKFVGQSTYDAKQKENQAHPLILNTYKNLDLQEVRAKAIFECELSGKFNNVTSKSEKEKIIQGKIVKILKEQEKEKNVGENQVRSR